MTERASQKFEFEHTFVCIASDRNECLLFGGRGSLFGFKRMGKRRRRHEREHFQQAHIEGSYRQTAIKCHLQLASNSFLSLFFY